MAGGQAGASPIKEDRGEGWVDGGRKGKLISGGLTLV